MLIFKTFNRVLYKVIDIWHNKTESKKKACRWVEKMLKLYELLENILLDIENNIKTNINASVLSKKYGFSEGHLRKLFSFAFKQSIASYIRSRRLAASLNDILETNTNILDIAIEYDFDYEQTYIRAFQREFGVTPGNLRKTGQIIKIKPPLHLFDENKLDDDSVIFKPDFVMVPQFHIIGKRHRILSGNHYALLPQLGRQFWENERGQIKGKINPNVAYRPAPQHKRERKVFGIYDISTG
jgi:AraC family transcriptional regulator